MVNIQILSRALSSVHPEYNANLAAMAISSVLTGGSSVQRYPDDRHTTYKIIDTDISLDQIKYIISQGGIVSGYAIAIEVDPSAAVPETIPDRTVVADDGAVTVLTWEEWCRAGNPNTYPTTVAGRTYIVPSAVGYETLNDFVAVIADWISIGDYQALFPSEE